MEGRHAHGELEAHGGWGEKYGCCVLPDGRSRAMVGERRGERPARGLSKKRPGHRVFEPSLGGVRVSLPPLARRPFRFPTRCRELRPLMRDVIALATFSHPQSWLYQYLQCWAPVWCRSVDAVCRRLKPAPASDRLAAATPNRSPCSSADSLCRARRDRFRRRQRGQPATLRPRKVRDGVRQGRATAHGESAEGDHVAAGGEIARCCTCNRARCGSTHGVFAAAR